MLSRKCRWALALTALIGITPAAMAQSSGFYILGTVGYTDHNSSLGDFNRAYGLAIPPTADMAGFDETKTAYKLGMGFKFHPSFAVEGAVGRLGRLNYNVSRPGAGGGTFQHAVEPEVWQLALVGMFPVSKEAEIFGKAGVAYIDNKGGSSQTGGFPAFGICGAGIVCQAGGTADDTVGVFGFGLNYGLGPNLFLRAEFEDYTSYKVANVPDLRPTFGPAAQAGGDIKLHSSVWSIGVGYKF